MSAPTDTTTVTNDQPTQGEAGALEVALAYAEVGLPVFPAHRRIDKVCVGCNKAVAPSLAEWDDHHCAFSDEPAHPAVPVPNDEWGGLDFGRVGTTDPDEIRRLWELYPNAHVALATADAVTAVVIRPASAPPKGSSPLQEWWHETGEVEVRRRVDAILGMKDAAAYRDAEGREVLVTTRPGAPLTSWSLPRTSVLGDDLNEIMLLPNSLAGWSRLPSAVATPPHVLAWFHPDEEELPPGVEDLDPDAFDQHAETYRDVVEAVRAGVAAEGGEPVAARKVTERLSGNNARKFERVREAALHPACPVVAEDGSGGRSVYSIA